MKRLLIVASLCLSVVSIAQAITCPSQVSCHQGVCQLWQQTANVMWFTGTRKANGQFHWAYSFIDHKNFHAGCMFQASQQGKIESLALEKPTGQYTVTPSLKWKHQIPSPWNWNATLLACYSSPTDCVMYFRSVL